MQSKATTVSEYLDSLPEDRRAAIETVRQTILKNLPKGYEEGMQYGMIGYFVPHALYPSGYHCDPTQPLPFAGLASQKNHMGLYLFCLYTDPDAKQQFINDWKAAGKKLDMGAACIRFKKIEDVPLTVLGRAIKRATLKKFIASYEANTKRPSTKKSSTSKPAAGKKTAAKKAASKKVTKKTAKPSPSKQRRN